uniref:Putative ATPase domain containing protein n=1 Tax=viral metagenome TaxID=1070528 RepID=A0A6M3J371_9ZZZZ
MKLKNMTLTNFHKFGHVSVDFDESITYLVGNNGAGKSSLGLAALWFIFQGIAEKSSGGNKPLIGERFRFIGTSGASTKGELTLFDEKKGEEIKVVRKMTKDTSVLTFEAKEGTMIDQNWLNDLFNICLISPQAFLTLSSKDQARQLGIDTSEFDAKIKELKAEATDINRDLKRFGEIVPVPEMKIVDIAELNERKEVIRVKLSKQYQANRDENSRLRKEYDEEIYKIRDNFEKQKSEENEKNVQRKAVSETINDILNSCNYIGFDATQFIKEINSFAEKKYPAGKEIELDLSKIKEPKYIDPEMPDDTELREIDQKITSASEINIAASDYKRYIEKVNERAIIVQKQFENKEEQKEQEYSRIAYIRNKKLPFDNLSIDEDGGLLCNDKPIREPYFSSGELIRIVPILMASQNPDMKYIFIQHFNLLDELTQKSVVEYLTDEGFQLCIEVVGEKPVKDAHCLILRDCKIVEDKTENAEQVKIL